MRLRSVHVLVAVVLAVAASTVQAGDKCRQAPERASADYLAPGPYAVGSETFTFVDTSRITAASGPCAEQPSRTLTTTVWFPATSPDDAFVDPSGAPYPMIASSHGLMAYRSSEEYLARHLASWGYVVSSQDFPRMNIADACASPISRASRATYRS